MHIKFWAGNLKTSYFEDVGLRACVCSTKVQNIRSKHNCLFFKEISYMFRLKYVAIIRLITKTKRKKKSQLLVGGEISNLKI
jgi:hypothetical protein